jgi:hypothetical protein
MRLTPVKFSPDGLPFPDHQALKLAAVMWECKDYADGWIRYFDELEALAYQRDTGCALRVTYRPAPTSKGASDAQP